MSASMPGGGKSANFELNLVPFIDLFSTLICFLLITAAWQNMESIGTDAPPKATQNLEGDTPPAPEPKTKKVELVVSLKFDRLEVFEDSATVSFPHIKGTPNFESLEKVLDRWKLKYPDRKDLILTTENRSPYKHLVKLMDVFIAKKFPAVGITLN